MRDGESNRVTGGIPLASLRLRSRSPSIRSDDCRMHSEKSGRPKTEGGDAAKSRLSKIRPSPRLQRRAAVLMQGLERLHWDNCKVIYRRGLAFTFALGALREGHEATDIATAYDRALHECHAFATDRTAHCGQVHRFEPSSTVSRARKILKMDGLTRAQRI